MLLPWQLGLAQPPVPLVLAPGAYMLPGVLAEPDSENRGRVVNIGILVGDEGALVIDSGANRQQGEEILAIAERLAGKPVRLLVNTHPHPQNVLGNMAFAARGVPILASARTREKMAERCPRCLASMTHAVGEATMAGTEIVLPNDILEAGTERSVAGRRIRFVLPGHGHSEGDLAVLDIDSGVVFAGDLVYRAQVPHLSEAHSLGWLAALDELRRQPVSILVPGRGPVGRLADIEPLYAYLSSLRAVVAAAYEAGLSPDETLQRAELPRFASWQGYHERHARNVQHVYFEFERADLAERGGGK